MRQGDELDGTDLFYTHIRLHGVPARPDDRVWRQKINPSLVFDLTLPLDRAADGYRAMDERTAIKALLQP